MIRLGGHQHNNRTVAWTRDHSEEVVSGSVRSSLFVV